MSTETQALHGTVELCRMCGSTLDESPSLDFCSETCQTHWHTTQTPTGAPADRVPHHEVPARSGGAVLDDVAAFIARFSVFPSEHCVPMLALWYAHTHAADSFYVTPRLILDSAEPGSGKTRVLEVAAQLVAAPEMTISATTAALFRMVNDGPLTILFDEVDAIFNPKAGGNYEDLRAMLNAGYKRSATIARCVGDARAMKVERFPVYAPAVLCGIAGHMPPTITTRAITVHMKRKRPDEEVEAFKERRVEREATPLRESLAGWIASIGDRLAEAVPDMPTGVIDRPAEIWEPLLAIADEAGQHWPGTARAACEYFVANAASQPDSLGIRLLADLRDLFTTRRIDRMTTTEITTALCELDEAPWADLQGKPLDARKLSTLLGKYGVKPANIKQVGSGKVSKGYRIDSGLADAWSRYLAPAATSATAATAQVNPVADTTVVADQSATTPQSATPLTRQVADVADVAPPPRRQRSNPCPYTPAQPPPLPRGPHPHGYPSTPHR